MAAILTRVRLLSGLLRNSTLAECGPSFLIRPVLRRRPVSPSVAVPSGLRPLTTEATSTAPFQPRKSLFRRFLTVCVLGVVFTSAGFVMASYPALEVANRMVTPPSDEESTVLFHPTDEQTIKIERFLLEHPVAQELRNNPDYIESRPHLKIAPELRSHSLTGGALSGPGKIWVPPIAFTHKDGNDITILAYLGNDLCGHPGVVHGGCMATLIDEGFARCCFSRLPHKIGMTANLNINYKAPLPVDSYICLKGKTTKVEGRKAWVEGQLESLVEPGQSATVHCNATALFVEPRQQAAMIRMYGSAAS